MTDYKKNESGQNLGHGENIEVTEMSFDEVIQMCLEGKMKEDRSVGILLPYLLKNR